MEHRTVVLLIDFHGHPPLGNEYENELRYTALKALLFNNEFPPLVIVSDHVSINPREEELKRLVDIEGRHTWIVIDPDNQPTTEKIIQLVATKGFKIRNVIIGGTNTTGCVLKSRKYSLLEWAKIGMRTTLFLPMCNDYQLPGNTWAERVMMAWSTVSKNLINTQATSRVDIEHRVLDLLLHRSKK